MLQAIVIAGIATYEGRGSEGARIFVYFAMFPVLNTGGTE